MTKSEVYLLLLLAAFEVETIRCAVKMTNDILKFKKIGIKTVKESWEIFTPYKFMRLKLSSGGIVHFEDLPENCCKSGKTDVMFGFQVLFSR